MPDLAVIGSGPAGCAAAIVAARAGLDVTLFESARAPRAAPGETFHPGIETLFERLGLRDAILAEGFRRHAGIRIAWDGPPCFEPYGADAEGPWRGFQVPRQRLQALMIEAAEQAGVVVEWGATADGLLFRDGRVCGVRVGGHALEARWTLDASGRKGLAAGQLDLETRVTSPRLVARYGWLAGEECNSEPQLSACAGGWDWRAPLGDGREAWVSLRAQATAGGGAEGGVDLSWRYLPAAAGAGYFVLGDAAATLDPASSHGVLRALMSGMLCAHLIQQRDASEEALVAAYREWLTGQFTHDDRALRELYGRHPSPAFANLFRASAATEAFQVS